MNEFFKHTRKQTTMTLMREINKRQRLTPPDIYTVSIMFIIGIHALLIVYLVIA